jgi:hypothetical protein
VKSFLCESLRDGSLAWRCRPALASKVGPASSRCTTARPLYTRLAGSTALQRLLSLRGGGAAGPRVLSRQSINESIDRSQGAPPVEFDEFGRRISPATNFGEGKGAPALPWAITTLCFHFGGR